MKRCLTYLFFACFLSTSFLAQINYNFSALGGAFVQNVGPTVIVSSGTDDGLSAATNIGFTFQYGCVNYTQFKASSNGWLTFNTAVVGSNLNNNLNTSADRPIVAPLWDDLACASNGNVNYRLTGVAPNRILTVEWLNMEWSYSASSAVISFQVKLYETTNRIEFVYRQEAAAVVVNGASIGLSGPISGDFYSLNNSSASPAVSQVVETTNINTKPANGQVYAWDPVLCSGSPTAGSASASPSLACAAYNTTLSVSGTSAGCGITYQWQIASAPAGPWSNIGGATASTTVVANPAAVRYYRCVLACGVFTAASTPATASITAGSGCGSLCVVNSITLPYSANGQTTCGQGNSVTSGNVTNVCGSANYYGGEDVVYSFTPSVSGQISITLNSSGSFTGLMLYQGCPLSGGTCVGNAQSSTGNKILCLNVVAGQPYFLVIDSWPSPTCNPYDISITAPSGGPSCSLSSYSPSSIAYSFDTFTGTVAPSTDDVLYNNIAMLGFNFCYTGGQYAGGYIASNGAFVFDAVPCYPNIQTTTYAAPGVGTGWSITAAAPVNNTSIPRNAILGPWQDIDPSLGGAIRYTTLGTAPNRRFVVSYENVPMFSCGTASASIRFTGQIKLFETSNDIEIHIGNKGVCPGWNSGRAVMGLHNFDGTIYIPPVNATAHNSPTQWSMTNTAYRFTSPCASSVCVVLPVEYKNFYGERIEKENHLYWETADEKNISYFSVERSRDAENFTEIGKVTPKHTASQYEFIDKTAAPGTMNYYRITSVEHNGKRKSTNVIVLGANEGELVVSGIYPNPVQDQFTVSMDAKVSSELVILIRDTHGRVLKSFSSVNRIGVSQLHLDAKDIPAGIYMIEISNSNKEIISKQKFVKID